MKKILSFFAILLIGSNLAAQSLPDDYNINGGRLSKTADLNPISNTIEKIFLKDNLILLATSKGMSKSTDYGNTWTNYGSSVFNEESVSAAAFNNGIIWVSTWHPQTFDGSVIGVGSGLKYSTDNGTTWTDIAQPMDARTDTITIYGSNRIKTNPTTVPQHNFVYNIAFTKNTIWIVSRAGGLRKSTDMGKSWQKILLPPDNLNSIKPSDQLTFKYDPAANLNHIAFTILALNDSVLFAGTAGGLNKTTDGGVSWTKMTHVNQTNSISGNYIWALAKNEYDNSIWAATWKAEGQSEFWAVSVSSDGGKNWTNYLSGERARDFGFKYFGTSGNYTGSEIFVSSESGVYRSANNGVTWTAAPQIIDNNTNISLNTNKFYAVEVGRRPDNSTDVWLGSDNGLVRFNETTGNWTGNWKIYMASEKLESLSSTYAFPNPFSPATEQVKIKYQTSNASNVTIRIFDFGMNLIRTIIQNAPRSANSEHIEYWDGKSESGKTVPNGVYFYRIDNASSQPLFGKIMVMM